MIIPLVCILQCWQSTRKQDWYARIYVVEYSSCHHNVQCGSFKLFFRVAVVCIVLCYLFFFFQRTARNCSKVRAARAAQCFVLVRPIKYLIIGVVIRDPAVDANTLLSYLLHRTMYVNYRYPLRNFIIYWIKENLFSSCLWLPLTFIIICLAVIF